MIEYIGMARGNLAWVQLRNDDLTSAYAHACEGAEKIGQTPQGHILLWVALWPLIGVAIARNEIADAIEHVEKLLIPPQMAIPDTFNFIRTWGSVIGPAFDIVGAILVFKGMEQTSGVSWDKRSC